MSPSVTIKKEATVILLADHSDIQLNLVSLIDAVCTSKSATSFLDCSDLSSGFTDREVSAHHIRTSNDTKLNILTFPELSSASKLTSSEAVLLWLQARTTTVDAFIALVDASQLDISVGMSSALESLSSIYPRPIHNNIFCLVVSTSLDGGMTQASVEITTGLPSWLPPKQIYYLDDMVVHRGNVRQRIEAKQAQPERLRGLFERRFLDACNDVQKMLEATHQSVVQAWDMRILYTRAVAIESELFDCIAKEPTLDMNNEALRNITGLVKEYCKIAVSPDFEPHVELVLAILRGGSERGLPGMEGNIRRLTEVLQGIHFWEQNGDRFPRAFVAG